MLDAQATCVIIRTSLVMQRLIGTVSAIEYLKSHAIGGAVIQRVLSNNDIRSEDRQALQALPDAVGA